MKIYIIIPILITLAIYSCSPKAEDKLLEEKPKSSFTEEKLSQVGISFAKVQQKFITSSVEANGYVELPPSGHAEVHSVIPGFTYDIQLITGDKVRKGQTLALLYSLDFINMQQQLLETSAKLEYLKLEKNRLEILRSENITSEKEYSEIVSEFSIVNSKKKTLEQILLPVGVNFDELKRGIITQYLSIKSPISGEVSDVFTHIGKYHIPGDKLMEIVNTTHVHAELKVFESDFSKIFEGQEVELKALGDTLTYNGTVYRKTGQIDTEGRYIRVHVHFESGQGIPAVGTYLQAIFVGKQEKHWVIDKSAIVEEEGKKFVFEPVMKSGSWYFVQREIKVGREFNEQFEVLNADSALSYVATGIEYIYQ